MADLQTRQRKGDPKRILPRIDMTPMVDLGFLLIAFFMFTTTLAQPKVMEVNMPYTEAPPEGGRSYPEESTVTLLLSSQHKVAYYYGNFESGEAFAAAGFEGNNPLRSVLLNKQQEAAKLPTTYSRQAHFLHVLIKPTDDCTYEDLVKALDEMSILDIRYYALADVSDAEKNGCSKIFASLYGFFQPLLLMIKYLTLWKKRNCSTPTTSTSSSTGATKATAAMNSATATPCAYEWP